MKRKLPPKKKAEELFKEAEEKYRNFFKGAVEGIFETSPQGKIQLANPALARILGYESPGELTSVVKDTTHLYADPNKRAELARLLEKQPVVMGFECEFLRRDRTKIWASINVRRVCSPDGKTLFYSGFLQDITERKRAEEALTKSEERFRTLAESALVGIYILQDGKYTYINTAMGEIFGYSPAEMIGMTPREIVQPSDHGMIAENIRRRISGEVPALRYEVQGRHKDGSTRDVEVFGTRLIISGRPALVGTLVDITERKRAAKALRESEERFRQVAESSSDFIWEVDANGLYTYASPSVKKILGYTPDELIGEKHFYDLFTPETREEIKSAALTAFAAKLPFRAFPNSNVSKGGNVVEVETSGLPMLDRDGNLTGYRGADTDITGRKQAERALEERLRFEQLLSNISSRFVNIPPGQVDPEIDRALNQILEFFGVDRCLLHQTMPDKAVWQIIHASAAEDVPPVPLRTELPISLYPWAYDKLARKGEVNVFSRLDDLPAEASVDRQTYMEWGIRSTLTIPIFAGGLVDHGITLNSVKSEKIWPEELFPRLRLLGEILVNALERKRAQAAIAASEVRYRTVADYTYDWEYWSAPDGTLNYVSPSCERISGYSVREFMDDPSLFLKIVVPEDREAWDRHDHVARSRGKPQEIQFRIRTKTGEIRWIEHACLSVRDDQGKFQGIRASNRDISDRKKAEFEAQKERNELAHVTRVAALGELTSSIAHELNQPLAAIRNYANAAQRFLLQGEPDLSKAREALEGIIRDDRRAAEVISRVRGLLKKEEPRYRPVDMNSVIQESLAFIHTDSVIKGLSIETALAPAVPVLLGDRVQLQQVLLNLILNAVDAMNKAKPDLSKLVIKTENEEDRGVKVSVRDFGTGIDEAQSDRLFEPFYTTKPAGMGMGLAISARIIHAHGGSIWAENNADGGATFYFTLPAGDKEDRV